MKWRVGDTSWGGSESGSGDDEWDDEIGDERHGSVLRPQYNKVAPVCQTHFLQAAGERRRFVVVGVERVLEFQVQALVDVDQVPVNHIVARVVLQQLVNDDAAPLARVLTGGMVVASKMRRSVVARWIRPACSRP